MNADGLSNSSTSNQFVSSPAYGSPTTPTFIPDYGWHRLDFDCPSTSCTMNLSNLYIDGTPIAAGCSQCSTVLNTDNSPASAEIRMFRFAAHGQDGYTGYLAQWEVSNVSRSASYNVTRFNNEIDPSSFYSFGTAIQPSGSTQNAFWFGIP